MDDGIELDYLYHLRNYSEDELLERLNNWDIILDLSNFKQMVKEEKSLIRLTDKLIQGRTSKLYTRKNILLIIALIMERLQIHHQVKDWDDMDAIIDYLQQFQPIIPMRDTTLEQNEELFPIEFICYDCRTIFSELVFGVNIPISLVLEDYLWSKKTTPDNGKIIIHSEIICPDCKSNRFFLSLWCKLDIMDYIEIHIQPKLAIDNSDPDHYRHGQFTFFNIKGEKDEENVHLVVRKREFRERIRKNKEDTDAWTRYGITNLRMNYYDIAKKALLRSLRQDKYQPYVYVGLIQFYGEREMKEKAEKAYRNLLIANKKIDGEPELEIWAQDYLNWVKNRTKIAHL